MEKPWVGKEASKSLIKELYSLQSDSVYCENCLKISDWTENWTAEVSPRGCPQVSGGPMAAMAPAGVDVQLFALKVQEPELRAARGEGRAAARQECRVQGCQRDWISCGLSIAHPAPEAVQGSEETYTAKYQLSASSLTRLYLPLRYRGFLAPNLCCQACTSGHI